jgi:hypothetical protein
VQRAVRHAPAWSWIAITQLSRNQELKPGHGWHTDNTNQERRPRAPHERAIRS